MQAFSNAGSGDIVLAIAQRIVENRGYLSDIDGLIGDGDHGVNMAKGFSLAAERLRGEPQSLAASLAALGDVLMTEIGGSMGPLYGMMFSGFADALDGVEEIDAAAFERMLRHGLEEVQSIGDAKVGDKTLIDAFAPALQAFSAATAKRETSPPRSTRSSSPPRRGATARSTWSPRSAGRAGSANVRAACSIRARRRARSFCAASPRARRRSWAHRTRRNRTRRSDENRPGRGQRRKTSARRDRRASGAPA